MYCKYVKYKTKYFDLKQLSCSTLMPINILLVTHDSSIKCLLERIIPERMSFLRDKYNVEKIEIKNSSVLKLELNVTGPSVISLIYEGQKPENKTTANYLTMLQNTNEIYFNSVPINLSKFNITKLNNKVNIFIVRHAQAEHNVNRDNKNKDTLLTHYTGIQQSNNLGIALRNILKGIPINYLFASKLRRTRQTLGIVMGHILTDPKDIIILPCLNELKMDKPGQCILKIPNKISIASQPVCNTNNDKCQMGDLCCEVNGRKINWDYYKRFNNNCLNTNIIKLIIDYIQN